MVREARVTVLTGARQVGKSTLLSHELGDAWRCFALDDVDVQGQARRDPELLLTAAPRLILDEAHLVPELFPAIKRLCDGDRARRFVLSGSANLLLLSRTSESLAGRAEFLRLLPMTGGELGQAGAPAWLEAAMEGALEPPRTSAVPRTSDDLAAWVWRGGMPEVLYRHSDSSLRSWRDGYLRSYLERDLRQLSQVDSLSDFKRLMSLAALRCGCLLNQSELARDAGLTQPTAHRYLGLLEVSEQCVRLPALHSNASKALVKSPKLMWTDTGVAAFCAGFRSAAELKASREWGRFLEAYVFNQLRAIGETWEPPAEMAFWRTRAGTEVDFVMRRGRRLLAIEVKAAERLRFEDTAGIQEFMRLHRECVGGIVLYSGREVVRLAKGLMAVPIVALYGSPTLQTTRSG